MCLVVDGSYDSVRLSWHVSTLNLLMDRSGKVCKAMLLEHDWRQCRLGSHKR